MNAARAYRCMGCGVEEPRRFECCPKCRMRGGCIPAVVGQQIGPTRRVLLKDAKARKVERIPVAEPWHTVLGGGLARYSSVLVDGRPKCGKTTELLKLAASVPGALFIPCEPNQDAAVLRMMADRAGLDTSSLYVADGVQALPDVLEALSESPPPPLAVVDSLSMLGDVEEWYALRAACRSCALVCVMHVTKRGSMAGRNQLRHLVDAVVHVSKTSLLVKDNRFAVGPEPVRVRR